MHFTGSNLSTDPKWCARRAPRGNASTKFWKTLSRILLVKYSAYAECEIIHFVNCEILLPQVAMWNEICPHSRSEYFTRRRRISHFAEIFHLPARANFVEKSTCLRKCFFLGRVSDLDARRFCIGYTNPLAMMGAALDRYRSVLCRGWKRILFD